jgi:hypothetical protein
MNKFNGMVQLLVNEYDRKLLFVETPEEINNTLRESQRCHHVTLAFKPSIIEFEYLKGLFSDGATFVADCVRYDDKIAAVYGSLFIHGKEVVTNAHITLGGCVPPKESNRLLKKGNSKFVNIKDLNLTFNVVNF